MICKRVILKTTLAMVLSFPTILQAGDLFNITASPDGGAPISVGGKSVIDLVNNLTDTSAQFISLANQNFSASLTYAGLKDAITFAKTDTSAGVSTVLSIPSIGFTRTFSGADNGQVKKQIEDFLKKDGSSTVSQFLQVINKETMAGVTDGNPLATTAIFAKQAFNQYGLYRSPFQLHGEGVDTATGGGTESRFDLNGGMSKTDAGDGYYASFAVGATWHLGNTVALSWTIPGVYREIEGSKLFNLGMLVGVPITIVPGKGDNTMAWTVTPSGMLGGAGSVDLASGGMLWGGNITSSLTYTLSDFTISMANQWGMYQGVPISYGDYRFETEVDQQILKNGLKLTKAFGNGFIDVGASYTNLLKDAAVKHYWSPEAGLGLRFGKGQASGFRIGYAGDYASNFKVHGMNAELFFSF